MKKSLKDKKLAAGLFDATFAKQINQLKLKISELEKELQTSIEKLSESINLENELMTGSVARDDSGKILWINLKEEGGKRLIANVARGADGKVTGMTLKEDPVPPIDYKYGAKENKTLLT